MVEVKPFAERVNGERKVHDFFVFINGEPRGDMDCKSSCVHFNPDGDCGPEDDLRYAFCGQVCGHFEMTPRGGAR